MLLANPNEPMALITGVVKSGGSKAVANVLFTEDHADGIENILLAAAKQGDLERLNFVLTRYQSDPIFSLDAVDKATGNSAIIWAAKRGHGSIVIELLKYGCDVTTLNDERQSAMELGSPAIRRLILENASTTSAFSYRLLLQAAWLGNSFDVRRLLSLAPQRINTNFLNSDGFNAIQLATRDISIMDKINRQLKGMTFEPAEVLQELLRYSYNPNEIGTASELKTALHLTAGCNAHCASEMVQLLLHSGGDHTCRDNFGYTPLHCAARVGNSALIRVLIENGALVNEHGKAGSTPLHLSATFAREEAVCLLLKFGANPREVDSDGQSPIDIAKTRRIKFLLEGKSPTPKICVDTKSNKPVSAGNNAPGKSKEFPHMTRAATCSNIFSLDAPSERNLQTTFVATPSISSIRHGYVRLSYSNNFREVSNLDTGRSSRCSSGGRSNRPSSVCKSSPTTPTSPGSQVPVLPRVGSGKKLVGIDLNSSVPFMTRCRSNLIDQRWFSRSNGDITRNSFDEVTDPSTDIQLQGRTSSKTCLEDVEDGLESAVIPLSTYLTSNNLLAPKEDLRTIHEMNEDSASLRIDPVGLLPEQTAVIPPIQSPKSTELVQENVTIVPAVNPAESKVSLEAAVPVAAAGNVPARRKPQGKVIQSESSTNRAFVKTKVQSNKTTTANAKFPTAISKQSAAKNENRKEPGSASRRSVPIAKNKIVVHKPLDEVINDISKKEVQTDTISRETKPSEDLNENMEDLQKSSNPPEPPKLIRNKTKISVKSSNAAKSVSKSGTASQSNKSSSAKGPTGKVKVKVKPKAPSNDSKKQSAVKPSREDLNPQSSPSLHENRPAAIISGIGWQISTDDLEYDDDFEDCDSGERTPTNSSTFNIQSKSPQEVTEMDTEVSAIVITEDAIERFRKLAEKELNNLLEVDIEEDIHESLDEFQTTSSETLKENPFDKITLENVQEDVKTESSSNVFDTASIVSSSSMCSEFEDGQEFNGIDVPNWRKLNRLGHGSFGTVYKGLTDFGTMIAVKQIAFNSDDDHAKSETVKIQEEIDILKNLNHRNVVQYLGTEMASDFVYIFMEFVAGGSLANLLSQMGAIDEHIFKRYTRQLVEGVYFLHNNEIMHRDIKSANIMLTHTGIVKLIDFGCAKRLQLHLSSSTSQQMSMKGSPYWMAPEVIRETGHGRKSDIWSLGCTVFEMATSKPPWGHLPHYAAIFAIGQDMEAPPQLSNENFSKSACDFVSICMTRDALNRPSAASLLQHSFLVHRKSSRSSRWSGSGEETLPV